MGADVFMMSDKFVVFPNASIYPVAQVGSQARTRSDHARNAVPDGPQTTILKTRATGRRQVHRSDPPIPRGTGGRLQWVEHSIEGFHRPSGLRCIRPRVLWEDLSR